MAASSVHAPPWCRVRCGCSIRLMSVDVEHYHGTLNVYRCKRQSGSEAPAEAEDTGGGNPNRRRRRT
eukprot:4301162-Prymnesium_polylepis.1